MGKTPSCWILHSEVGFDALNFEGGTGGLCFTCNFNAFPSQLRWQVRILQGKENQRDFWVQSWWWGFFAWNSNKRSSDQLPIVLFPQSPQEELFPNFTNQNQGWVPLGGGMFGVQMRLQVHPSLANSQISAWSPQATLQNRYAGAFSGNRNQPNLLFLSFTKQTCRLKLEHPIPVTTTVISLLSTHNRNTVVQTAISRTF